MATETPKRKSLMDLLNSMDRKSNREVFGIDKTSEEIKKELMEESDGGSDGGDSASGASTLSDGTTGVGPVSDGAAYGRAVTPSAPAASTPAATPAASAPSPAATPQPAPTAPAPQQAAEPEAPADGTPTEINGVPHIFYGGVPYPVAIPGGYTASSMGMGGRAIDPEFAGPARDRATRQPAPAPAPQRRGQGGRSRANPNRGNVSLGDVARSFWTQGGRPVAGGGLNAPINLSGVGDAARAFWTQGGRPAAGRGR